MTACTFLVKSLIMRRLWCVFVFFLLSVCRIEGSLVVQDLHALGDGLLTLDTDTGLRWLDLTETTNRSFDDMVTQFGPGGETWLRFNIATPRPILEDALSRLNDAFRDLRS